MALLTKSWAGWMNLSLTQSTGLWVITQPLRVSIACQRGNRQANQQRMIDRQHKWDQVIHYTSNFLVISLAVGAGMAMETYNH